MVPTHRVVPAGDGEDPTSVSIPGFLVDPKAAKTKKTFAPIKVEMQFLENHKTSSRFRQDRIRAAIRSFTD